MSDAYTIGQLHDLLTRIAAVMDTTYTEHGEETVADAHHELYVELGQLAGWVDACAFSFGEVTFRSK